MRQDLKNLFFRSLPWIIPVLVGVMVYIYWPYTPRTMSVVVVEEPKQRMLTGEAPWVKKGYVITPLAAFSIRAKVLHTRQYRWDRGAELSPIDLALGWGLMSDPRLLEKITIEQSNRWYFWRYDEPLPINNEYIIAHSANMHMIPANDEVRALLLSARPNEIVSLNGYLVKVVANDGYTWASSLSRTDTGAGSCELVWVENASIEK